MRPTMLAILTILPHLCFIICLITAWVQMKAPWRLIFSTRSQSDSDILMSKPSRVIPALFTRMSICPNVAIVCSTSLATSAAAVTLAGMAMLLPFFAWISAAVSCAVVGLTSLITRAAPYFASINAISLPIPWPLPVTIATLLDKFIVCSHYLELYERFLWVYSLDGIGVAHIEDLHSVANPPDESGEDLPRSYFNESGDTLVYHV